MCALLQHILIDCADAERLKIHCYRAAVEVIFHKVSYRYFVLYLNLMIDCCSMVYADLK